MGSAVICSICRKWITEDELGEAKWWWEKDRLKCAHKRCWKEKQRGSEATEKELVQLPREELEEMCHDMGLLTSGSKEVLASRIMAEIRRRGERIFIESHSSNPGGHLEKGTIVRVTKGETTYGTYTDTIYKDTDKFGNDIYIKEHETVGEVVGRPQVWYSVATSPTPPSWIGLFKSYSSAKSFYSEGNLKSEGYKSNPGFKPTDLLPQNPRSGPPLPQAWGIHWPGK